MPFNKAKEKGWKAGAIEDSLYLGNRAELSSHHWDTGLWGSEEGCEMELQTWKPASVKRVVTKKPSGEQQREGRERVPRNRLRWLSEEEPMSNCQRSYVATKPKIN